ncbi:anti-sigma factor [Rhodobacteraceae bacterium S2214]|nr:anti-sigma factor [Rhodobacteraceae bacterium S2214]
MSKQADMTPDDTEFAAEYVLRVLPDDAHRAAAARAASDPEFAAQVREWEDRLAPLTDEIMPVTPSGIAKSDLMERLFGVDPAPGLLGRVGFWKGLTVVLSGAAIASTLILFGPTEPVAVGPTYVSELAAENDDLRILAVYDVGAENIQITRTSGAANDGRSLQLWCLVDGVEPRPVGVLTDDPTATIRLPAAWFDGVDNWSLAVSDEPLGGSPTGLPTGDVLAVAEMTRL